MQAVGAPDAALDVPTLRGVGPVIGETLLQRLERREAELRGAQADLAAADRRCRAKYPLWAVVLVAAIWSFSIGELAVHTTFVAAVIAAMLSVIAFLLGAGMPRG